MISAVGTEVPVWEEGERVAVAAGKACLSCRSCASGRLEECRAPQIMGAHYDGGWAEHLVAPWYALARLPDGVPFEHGAIACDAVSTPYAALLERGGLAPGRGGAVGHRRARDARGADRPPGRSGVHRRGRPTARRPRTRPGPRRRPRTRSRRGRSQRGARRHGRQGLDLAVDLIGRQAVVRQAMTSLTRGGRVVLVGQSFESLDAGPIAFLSFLGIGMLGHLGYSKGHLEEVLALMASGRLDVSGSISGRYQLDRAGEAVERLASKQDAPVRLLITPRA